MVCGCGLWSLERQISFCDDFRYLPETRAWVGSWARGPNVFVKKVSLPTICTFSNSSSLSIFPSQRGNEWSYYTYIHLHGQLSRSRLGFSPYVPQKNYPTRANHQTTAGATEPKKCIKPTNFFKRPRLLWNPVSCSSIPPYPIPVSRFRLKGSGIRVQCFAEIWVNGSPHPCISGTGIKDTRLQKCKAPFERRG